MRRLSLLLSVVALAALAGCPKGQVSGPAKPGVNPAKAVDPAKPGVNPAKPAVDPAKPAVVQTGDKGLDLVAVKNARVFFHSGEVDMNGGGCHRLRASDLALDSADVSIIDFDRAKLKAFLDKSKEKDRAVSAKLVLAVRAVDKGPGKLEVAALDTASDWNQGDKDLKEASKGEVCCSAAQFEVKPWTTTDGKPAKDLRELVFGRGGKVKALLNSKGAQVADEEKGKTVDIELDGKFLEHLGQDANCRGIVVFTRSENARIYFSSRDKENLEPRVVVTAK